MTKTEALTLASAHGLAVYRGDTAATIFARLNAHLAVQAGIISDRVAGAKFHLFVQRQHYRARTVQLRLAMVLPRDFSGVRGVAA